MHHTKPHIFMFGMVIIALLMALRPLFSLPAHYLSGSNA